MMQKTKLLYSIILLKPYEKVLVFTGMGFSKRSLHNQIHT